jgi:hypothetical protein
LQAQGKNLLHRQGEQRPGVQQKEKQQEKLLLQVVQR